MNIKSPTSNRSFKYKKNSRTGKETERNKPSEIIDVCIIGAGRVGITLAAIIAGLSPCKGLSKIRLGAVCSRSPESIENARKFLKKLSHQNSELISGILFSTNNIEGVNNSNAVFLCTPDDNIIKVSEEIVDANIRLKEAGKTNDIIKNKIFIHFSGAKSLAVLSPLKEAGGQVGSIHPIKSFASIENSVKSISGTVYGVTYPDPYPLKLKKFINDFLKTVNGKIIEVKDDKKSVYHAAACVASNYLVSLINYAMLINKKIGINPKDSLAGLTGLIEGTISNIKKLGTTKALTGPIARGDVGTIQEHLESFKKFFKEEDYVIYKVMGIETAKIAYENGWISRETLENFNKILH